jgi:hypothetical protein
MLNIVAKDGLNRRAFLKVGSLTLGGLSLPMLLRGRAAATESGRSLATGKSVIFLMQQGGPSQFETWDPKMNAPSNTRSQTGEVQTSVPGLTFGGTYTRLAPWAHRLAIVRSYHSGNGNHDIKPIVSPASLNANVGSLYARVVGTTRPTGMPTNCAVFPNAVDPTGPAPNNSFGVFASSGTLGPSYVPFVPGTGGQLQQNMRLNVPPDQLGDRRYLLSQLDELRAELDLQGESQALDQIQQQAFDVILGGVADAFDLSKEDPRVIDRYDTASLLRTPLWTHKNNRDFYNAHAKSLGKLLLLARRLCQAGCGFVTVNTAFVWDMHSDVNNLPVREGMDFVGSPLDVAVSAFIEDLEARGLSDDILLVVTGEMGRTPRVNNQGGRDHWGNLTPLLLYGGGLTHGQVIGRSTADGSQPLDTPVSTTNLIATIMNTVFDVPQARLDLSIPTEVRRVITEGTPIPGLF